MNTRTPVGLVLAACIAIAHMGISADALDGMLRSLEPAVIARIVDDRVILDLRTILPEQDELLADLLVGLRR